LQHCSESTRIDADTHCAITTGLLEHQNKAAAVGKSKLSIQSNVVAVGKSKLLFCLLKIVKQMKYATIQTKTATKFLIDLINTVESSDKVSQLLNLEFDHYIHESSLLDFQRNAVFNTLTDQSKSVYSCSLISLLKALFHALQCKF
jgi:hypothetical protein